MADGGRMVVAVLLHCMGQPAPHLAAGKVGRRLADDRRQVGGGDAVDHRPDALGTSALLGVRVPLQAGHSEQSEVQLRKGDRPWGGSTERSREPMNKNRIRGDAVQGEQAKDCEALVAKGQRRKSGGCAVTERVLTRGDLALCLKGRRW